VAGTDCLSVAVADLNGDGALDLVTANFGDDAVGVLLGKGDGTFRPVMSFSAGPRPFAVAVGDFNSDGFPDVAVPNLVSFQLSVLLNAADW
jgi:hypothetical protein